MFSWFKRLLRKTKPQYPAQCVEIFDINGKCVWSGTYAQFLDPKVQDIAEKHVPHYRRMP